MAFETLTTEQLKAWVDKIDTDPEHRVKRGGFKGCLKQKSILKATEIAVELRARGWMKLEGEWFQPSNDR